MAADLELVRNPKAPPREPPTDVAAVQAENKQLRELVVELSRLVVKYVMREH